jgi:hypothetical protein
VASIRLVIKMKLPLRQAKSRKGGWMT